MTSINKSAYTSNRYIVRTTTNEDKGGTYYRVYLSCGAGSPMQMAKRLGKVNNDKELAKRTDELNAINAEYRIMFFGSDKEACQYTRDTTAYLNRGRELPFWMTIGLN